MKRALAVRDIVAEMAPSLQCTAIASEPGARAPRLVDGATPEDNRWAVVDVRFTILPGEHGFRFFPSYYNHVFDTMRRIPLLDADGNETGWSTCSKRRAKELERISWWEYLEGYNPDTGTRLYRYSDRFERDAKTQSRVLASFDAVWGDARTVGNTYVQLLYNWLRTLPKVDGTLNGPTSEAWFGPWRTYLERRLGVQFLFGELKRSEVFYRSTPAGDYCRIWDMEHWELPELVLAKQYDEWCFDRGLPHPWDILGIERMPALVSQLGGALGGGRDAAEAMSGAVRSFAAGFPAGFAMDGALDSLLETCVRLAYPWGGGEAVLQMLRGMRKAIEDGFKGPGAAESDRPK